MAISTDLVWTRRNAALNIARGFKIPGHDVEDIASEALLHLHKRVEEANARGEEIDNFTNWSTYIMKRRVLDIRRGTLMNATSGEGEKLPWHLSSESANNHVPSEEASPLSSMIGAEEREQLQLAATQLPPRAQQVVQCILDGRSDPDAAKYCGIPVETYWMRKTRAIKNLRKLMVSNA